MRVCAHRRILRAPPLRGLDHQALLSGTQISDSDLGLANAQVRQAAAGVQEHLNPRPLF